MTMRTQVTAAMIGLAAAFAIGLSTELLAKGSGGTTGGGGGNGGSAGTGGKSGGPSGGGGSGGNSGGSGGGSGGKSSKSSKSGGKAGPKPRCGEEQSGTSKEAGERRCRDQWKGAREECDRNASDAGSGK